MSSKLIVAFLAIFIAISGKANIVYVDSSNIAGSQLGTSWATAYYSFEYGVLFSNPGDTIYVAKGTYTPNSGNYYTMKENVKIFGGFLNTDTSFSQRNWTTRLTTLKGNQYSVIRNDSALGITPLAVLDGFTITRGKAPDSKAGGGMYNNYASPTIRNCIFSKNYTSLLTNGGGGGMYNYHANPQISNCQFTQDTVSLFLSSPPNATGSGTGGAITNISSSPVISHCAFTNNVAIQASGGAISNDNNSSPVITFCTFDQNKCVFGNSVGYMAGAAIYQKNGGQLTLDSCKFTNNTNGFAGGGGVEVESTFLQMSRCVLQNNTSNTANFGGGALRCQSLTTGSSVDSCYFSGNLSSLNGGAIYNTNTNIQITNSTFYRNRAVESGGAIYNSLSVPVVSGCTFLQNRSSANAANTSFGNNCFGGAIYSTGTISGATHYVTNCSFTKDTAAFGAGIYHLTNVPYSINNCTFTQNVANAGAGGGLMISSLSSFVAPLKSNITSCSFTSNSSATGSGGGAICFQGYIRAEIDSCSFVGNLTSNTSTFTSGGVISGGGAIFSNADSISIAHSSFANNRAKCGGAICQPSGSGVVKIFISDCQFNNNVADSLGGAIAGAMGNIYRTTITADTATRWGGGIFGGGYPIVNCKIEGNKSRRGGGIYSIDSTTMVNCLIVKNFADSLGGGMYNSKPPRVTSATFANNRGYVAAGAIYNTNFGAYTDSTFTNCIVYGNNSGVFNQNTSNSVFSYSLVQGLGAFPAKHLLDGSANPKFFDTTAGNYQLLITSPCIDTGRNNAMPVVLGVTTDYSGNARIVNNRIDLGAYESLGVPLSLKPYDFKGYMANKQTAVLELELNTGSVLAFELEKSTNGIEFSKIDRTMVNGEHSFGFTDDFLSSTNYYRLRFTYQDGSSGYSNTVVLLTNTDKNSARVYPNPVRNEIHVDLGDDKYIGERLNVYDVVGKLLITQIISGKSQLVQVSELGHGVYFIKIGSGQPIMFYKD